MKREKITMNNARKARGWAAFSPLSSNGEGRTENGLFKFSIDFTSFQLTARNNFKMAAGAYSVCQARPLVECTLASEILQGD